MTYHGFQRALFLFMMFVTGVIIGLIILGIAEGHDDTPCLEDQPCWDWETMGNRCTGDGTGTTICVN